MESLGIPSLNTSNARVVKQSASKQRVCLQRLFALRPRHQLDSGRQIRCLCRELTYQRCPSSDSKPLGEMKLRGLPLDIRPGPVDLTVSPAPCPLLQPCLHCKLYNRVYFICVKSHITCMDCYLPDTSANKLTRPQYESYCKPCNLKVTLHRIEVPLPLLKALSFICGCGFTGRLCEIKKHVKSDDFSMGCSLLAQSVPPASDQFDVVLAKLQLELQEVANDYQAQLLVIKEKFQHSFGNKVENSAPNTTVFSKKQTDAAILNIGLLNRRLKVLLSETTLLRKRSVKITPRVQDEFGRVLMDIRKNVLENEYPIRPKEQEEAKRKD